MSFSDSYRRAVILAAGKGDRLLPLTADRPKTLIQIDEETILEHLLRLLKSQGVDDIVVVTGYHADMVRAVVGRDAQYFHNEIYEKTNSLYSLWVAREALDRPCFVVNSDVLFHVELLRRLKDDPAPDALAIEFKSGMGEEEMKVRTEGGMIAEISKTMPLDQAEGENVGIIKLSVEGARAALGVANECNERGELKKWAPYAVHALAGTRPFKAVDITGLPWIEIDFAEDLEIAREVILPKILESIK